MASAGAIQGAQRFPPNGRHRFPPHSLLLARDTLLFMGYRFALFAFSTETPGGSADFDYLRLEGLADGTGESE